MNIPKQQQADIILAICPPWDIKMPPLGIAYLSRYLRGKKIIPLVLDLNIVIFNSIPEDMAHLRRFWLSSNLWAWINQDFSKNPLNAILTRHINDWAEKIAHAQTSNIGFSVNRANLRFTIELSKTIKRLAPHKTIIFGGHACSIWGERRTIPDGLIDFFILGEGERALAEILGYLKRKQKITEISDCLVKNEDGRLLCCTKEPIDDLHSIAFPDFIEFNLESYQRKMLPLLGSRGCFNRCSFCNDWVVWPKYRFRKGADIFEEVLHHVKTYNIDLFEFCDLTISGNLREIKKFCDLIIDSGIKINWISNFTIIPIKDPDLFKHMKAAGCFVLRFGIETASDKVLRKMNKSFTISEAENILKQSHDAGIENHINIIVGFPGENDDDFYSTLSFIERNKDIITRVANVHPCFLTPQSEIEKNYMAYDIVLPEKDHAVYWHGAKGNTYQERKKRALKVRQLAQKLNITLKDSALIFFDEWEKSEEAKFQN